MKRLLLFAGIALCLNSAWAQGTWGKPATTWTYNPGTNTGTGAVGGSGYTLTPATNVSTPPAAQGFMPYAPSGSVGLFNVSGATGKWYLTGTTSAAKIRFSSSTGGKVAKLGMYNIDNATSVSSFFFTMEFNASTSTGLDWRFAVGNGTATLTGTAGLPGDGATTSFPNIFSTLRWNLGTSGTALTCKYAVKAAGSSAAVTENSLSGVTFSKTGTYNMEVYCNNSSQAQEYTRGSVTYNIPSRKFHVWANGTQLKYGTVADLAAMQVSQNEPLDGFAIQGGTSTPAGSSELFLSNISIKQVVSPLDEDEEGPVADTVYPIVALDAARISTIKSMLPAQPTGFGPPIENRTAWNALRTTGKFNSLISSAGTALSTFPALTDATYLSYWTAGDSQTPKTIMTNRRNVLSTLVWAYCLTDSSVFLPRINQVLDSLLNQKSWNFPSEDRSKTNFNGTKYTIALSAAAYGHEIAQTLYLLNTRLSATMKTNILAKLDQRIFDPTLASINNLSGQFIYLTSTGNHNPACLSGVTGAALAAIADSTKRATFVAIAERYSKNGIAGFLDDGYCTEGMRYYNYGFTHYITMREAILQATSDTLDLFNAEPKILKIASYGPNMEILNNLYPSIADSGEDDKPSNQLMYYVNRTKNLGLTKYNNYTLSGSTNTTLAEVMWAFPNDASTTPITAPPAESAGIRSYFDQAGVLTVRPQNNTILKMGATFKGGNNGELHNHNDVGSYTIVSGKVRIMGDVGTIPYNADLFNSNRYKIKTVNSEGHPVPKVDSVLQSTGAAAKAVIEATSFTSDVDVITMDLKSAYNVPALTKLKRIFTYNRTDTGFVRIKDDFEFNTPKRFETAVVTRSNFKDLGGGVIELEESKEKVLLFIQASSAYTMHVDTITETANPYKRIAFRLTGAQSSGAITLTYRRPGLVPVVNGNWDKSSVSWTYNPNVNTSTGILNGAPFTQPGTSVTTAGGVTGFMPIPESGSIKLWGSNAGTAKWWLTGTTANAAVRFGATKLDRIAKMALYDVENASSVSKIAYQITFNDSTTVGFNWQFAIGKTDHTSTNNIISNDTLAIPNTGTTSNPELFASVKWFMSNNNLTFSYRNKATSTSTVSMSTIYPGFFARGGTYNMEFYCNNSTVAETYTRGGVQYTVQPRNYHIWANNTRFLQSGTSDYDFPANELAADSKLDGMLFTSLTSISSGVGADNAAEIRLSGIKMNSIEQDLPMAMMATAPQKTANVPEEEWFKISVDQEAVKAMIFTKSAGNALISITGIYGSKISKGHYELSAGYNEINLPVSNLNKGVYIGTLSKGGKHNSIKFIK